MVLCEALYAITALHVLYYVVYKFVGWFKISGLSGKCVLITGCDTGFGRLAVEKCLNEGMIVFAACLHEKSVHELSDKAAAVGGRTIAFTMDVRSDESVQAGRDLVESRLAKYQGLHAIVNNAGIAKLGHDDWVPVDDYKENLDVDVLGAIRVVHAFLPLVKKAKGGRIVNPTGWWGRVTGMGYGPYGVAQAALYAYSDALRRELSAFGISVSIVDAMYFRTGVASAPKLIPTMKAAWKNAPESVKDEYGDQFYEQFLGFYNTFYGTSWMTSPRFDHYTDAYFHAISSVWPKAYYLVGPLWPLSHVLAVLPYGLQDYIMAAGFRAFGYPTPAAVA